MRHFFSLFEDPIKVSIIYHVVDQIQLFYNIYPYTLINILSRHTITGKKYFIIYYILLFLVILHRTKNNKLKHTL